MAGNIIPAIATTNAIIAGVIVMESLKILAGDLKKCKMVSDAKRHFRDFLFLIPLNSINTVEAAIKIESNVKKKAYRETP